MPSIITSISVWLAYDQVKQQFTPWGDDSLAFGNLDSIYIFEICILVSVALQALAVYLVIKWSRKHNEKYSTSQGQVQN
jgi:cell division protein FtsX